MQGDTWSSELGVLSTSNPFLIIGFKTVPVGTNGAVSGFGFFGNSVYVFLFPSIMFSKGAFLGGAILGSSIWITDALMGSVIPGPGIVFSTIAWALIGSVLDSLLGATLQFSGWNKLEKVVVESPGPNVVPICGANLLDNHQVNLLTSLIILFSALLI
jgi:uncharacterized membrane protein